MSVQAMARVWDLDLPHAERLVLLALADHADHVGDNIYPSIGLIAWKTGYSSRQVQRIIKSLVQMEILCVVDEPEGRTTVYRMDLKAGTVKEPYLRQNVRGDKMSGVTKQHPQGGQNVTPTPDIAMSPEPSVKPSRTISGGDTRERQNAAAAVDQNVVTRLVKECKLDRGMATTYARLHTFTSDELDRLVEWCKVKRTEGKNPAAILTKNYAPYGDLPDDLPKAHRIDCWPHRPDGSVDTEKLNEIARREPAIMTNRWVYQ